MINIDEIKILALLEIYATRLMENSTKSPILVFAFGRSFMYGCNLLTVHYSNPGLLNDFEKSEVPQYISLFEEVEFDLSLFRMNKVDICDKLEIEYYTVSYTG